MHTQVFPESARVGDITLVDYSIIYQFRVSASVMVDQTYNEGEMSAVTPNAILFVPKPGNWSHLSVIGYVLN